MSTTVKDFQRGPPRLHEGRECVVFNYQPKSERLCFIT